MRRLPGSDLVAHSDRGIQYASEHYQRILAGHGIACSMSRRGNCWDNAPMESFFASLKKELIHHEDYATREEAKASIFEYIEVFYNRVRRHFSLGYQSPNEFERAGSPLTPRSPFVGKSRSRCPARSCGEPGGSCIGCCRGTRGRACSCGWWSGCTAADCADPAVNRSRSPDAPVRKGSEAKRGGVALDDRDRGQRSGWGDPARGSSVLIQGRDEPRRAAHITLVLGLARCSAASPKVTSAPIDLQVARFLSRKGSFEPLPSDRIIPGSSTSLLS